MERTRVLIVDDHGPVIEGLRALFETDDRSVVVGEATSGREAVEKAKTLHPDIVLMDFALGDIDGIEAGQRIRRDSRDTDVVILSVYDGEPYRERMTHAGITSWITKATPADVLLEEVARIGNDRRSR